MIGFRNDTLEVSYHYDALGRRLIKHSQAHYRERASLSSLMHDEERRRLNQSLGCGMTLYGWDGDTLAWEGYNDLVTHYVYEPGSFVPLAQATSRQPLLTHRSVAYAGAYDIDKDPLWTGMPTPDPVDVLAWYQCDHLGTPQELTDEQGDIVWSAQYKAWGEVREVITQAAQSAGIRNPIRFQGQYHDHETGLHYNRHRYYDPQTGRFIGKDPIGYAGGLNLYQYADNPIEWVDPLGLSGRTPAGRLADRTQRLPASQRPNTVAVIVTPNGRVIAGRNQGGVTNVEVQESLRDIPPNDFDAQCAEVNAILRARNKGVDISNSTISIANVRGQNSTSGTHGTDKSPCSVCDPLMRKFNMKLLQRCSSHG